MRGIHLPKYNHHYASTFQKSKVFSKGYTPPKNTNTYLPRRNFSVLHSGQKTKQNGSSFHTVPNFPQRPVASKLQPTLEMEFITFGMGAVVGSFTTLALSYLFYFRRDEKVRTKEIEDTKSEARKKDSRYQFLLDWINVVPIELLQTIGSLGVMATTFLLLKRRATNQWTQRQFLSRVSFSINSITSDKQLEVRTLFERNLEQLLLQNNRATALVLSAAGKATLSDPILQFPYQDGWIILNSVLNEVSSINPVGFLLSGSHSMVHKWFVFGITCEKNPELFQKKLRVLLITESELRDISIGKIEEPKLSNEFLKVRWETLQTMAKHYRFQNQFRDTVEQLSLGKVEIVLPKSM